MIFRRTFEPFLLLQNWSSTSSRSQKTGISWKVTKNFNHLEVAQKNSAFVGVSFIVRILDHWFRDFFATWSRAQVLHELFDQNVISECLCQSFAFLFDKLVSCSVRIFCLEIFPRRRWWCDWSWRLTVCSCEIFFVVITRLIVGCMLIFDVKLEILWRSPKIVEFITPKTILLIKN